MGTIESSAEAEVPGVRSEGLDIGLLKLRRARGGLCLGFCPVFREVFGLASGIVLPAHSCCSAAPSSSSSSSSSSPPPLRFPASPALSAF
jgi:hypothetical protein